MKLFSVSIGLLLAALGVFYVPVSFSVDGFGLVVNPGGVRTVRATEPGLVVHFPSHDGRFLPGQIVTAVIKENAVAENALLQRTMHRELAKVETDHLDRTSKLGLDLERDRAKLTATADRLATRMELTQDTSASLVALQQFTKESLADIDALNAERLSQLSKLEDLVKRSGEVSALPAQRLATTLDDIQGDRLSVITSQGTRFASEKKILDMIKSINDLEYSNAIDAAEIDILTDRLDNLQLQMRELEVLRDTARSEAEARYLAKAVLPQVAVSSGISVDMRTLQASRADVAKGDGLRLLAADGPTVGISALIYGSPTQGEMRLRYQGQELRLSLLDTQDEMMQDLQAAGLDVVQVYTDEKTVGAIELSSIFVELDEAPEGRLSVISAAARDAQGLPVLVTVDISLPDTTDQPSDTGTTNEIIGFLENRHAVVLRPGQSVRGSINDTRTGSEIVFEAKLLDRDYSTVDTKELGIRLGNESLAAKIIKRGVLSQVVVGVTEGSAQQIEHLPGAVVHLSFPLGRQSLFNFLLARNEAI